MNMVQYWLVLIVVSGDVDIELVICLKAWLLCGRLSGCYWRTTTQTL